MNKVDDKLTNYSAYLDGNNFLGVVDVELPSLEALTEEVKGAGIAGSFDSPVVGHYGSMSVKLNWRTIQGNVIKLAKNKAHPIVFRGSQQVFNSSTGDTEHQPVKISVRALPKTTESGKFEVAATTGSANELEVIYLKIEIDGKVVTEIDKLNFICVIDGEDQLAGVRKNLGM